MSFFTPKYRTEGLKPANHKRRQRIIFKLVKVCEPLERLNKHDHYTYSVHIHTYVYRYTENENKYKTVICTVQTEILIQ